MAIGRKCRPELLNANLPNKKFIQSPIECKRLAPDDVDLCAITAQLASVFGDIDKPLLSPVSALGGSVTTVDGDIIDGSCKCESTQEQSYSVSETPSASLPRSVSDAALGFGGEADLNSFNAHLPNDTKINPNNFMEEPDGACWRIKTLDFGHGLIEVVASKQFEKFRPKNNKTRISKSRDEMIPEQLEMSIQRAKRTIRHKAMMLGADRLVTFTTRFKLTNREKANIAWAKFIKLVGKEFDSFDFIAVQEEHKTGHIHIHVLLNKYYPVNTLRKLWHIALGAKKEMKGEESPGNVNIRKHASYIQGSGQSVKQIATMARYLAKYIDKGIDSSELNKKRYSSSRGIPKPIVKTYFLPLGDNTFRLVGDILMQENNIILGKPLEFGSIIWWSSYT